jgi:hypothetical protein
MKKYRIITNGSRFRIQYRWWGVWRLLTEDQYDRDGKLRVVLQYETEDEARSTIERYTTPEWRVLG